MTDKKCRAETCWEFFRDRLFIGTTPFGTQIFTDAPGTIIRISYRFWCGNAWWKMFGNATICGDCGDSPYVFRSVPVGLHRNL